MVVASAPRFGQRKGGERNSAAGIGVPQHCSLYRGHEDVADDPGDEKRQVEGYWRDGERHSLAGECSC